MKENFEFVDIEPLLITLENDEWVHPYIEKWYHPDADSKYDDDMFRVYLTNSKKQRLYVYFKSEYLENKVNKWMEQDDCWNRDKQELFNPPYIDTNLVYSFIQLTLQEDIWSPAPPRLDAIESSKDYEQWRTEYPTEQFCFTEFGKKVNKFLQSDAIVDFFSLDCGLTTDGEKWYCDS
jgi:hypothetical protein